MTPLEFLCLVLTATVVAASLQYIQRQRSVRRLRQLASQLGLNYSPTDRFRIAPRVALSLPVPGAAAVFVRDLLYGQEEREYRYIFRTEYTVGVLRTKTAVRQVAMCCEPRDACTTAGVQIIFAPDNLPLVEQYRHLYEASRTTGSSV